jgi:hypothetical protein
MDHGMKKIEYNYLRIRFRITSDRIDESEIEQLIGFQELKAEMALSSQAILEGRIKELKVMGKMEGEDKWDKASKILNWVNRKEAQFKQLGKNADVELELASVCNIKGLKNPFPEEIKRGATEMKFLRISVVAEAKESVERAQ